MRLAYHLVFGKGQARIDQIRLNLERARWVLHAVHDRLVLVDVAGFRLHYFYGDDRPAWTTRVVVGKLDWAGAASAPFPYQLRQDPGPENALGRIKFMFPNTHSVYLHDTPSRELFGKAERAGSSGCIRVENPIELAVLLLDDPASWSREALERALATDATRTVTLREPVPVILMYWTLGVDADGSVSFKRDVYARDTAVREALDGDFSFRRRPVAGRKTL